MTPCHPPPTDGGKTAASSKFPFRFRSTTATYTSSASTSLSVYADLPEHHLRSTLDLIATPPVSLYPEDPTSGEDECADTDFSSCGDLETFMCFLRLVTTASATPTLTVAATIRRKSVSTSRLEGCPLMLKGAQGPLSGGTRLRHPTRLPRTTLEHAGPHQPPQKVDALISSSATS